MGCDIHLRIEVRKDGKWQPASAQRVCDDCKGTGNRDRGGECYWCKGTGNNSGFQSRAYDTFGALANVRNGTWGDPVPFIDEPRGLPDDLSPELKAASGDIEGDEDGERGWAFGDHSFSWLTLKELLAYNWDATVEKRAYVDATTFAAWEASGDVSPGSYCAGTNSEVVSNEEMRRRLAAGIQPREWVYTLAVWREPVAKLCAEFHDDFIPALMKLGEPDDVRIVFGFDS
jgi:hypothetical protein